jgi:hypothetical protein
MRRRPAAFESLGDGLHLNTKLGKLRIGAEESQLKSQHQEIKTLDLLVFLGEFRGQARDVLGQLVLLIVAEPVPGLCLAMDFDEFALGPHDEIIDVHGSDFVAKPCSGRAHDRGDQRSPYAMSHHLADEQASLVVRNVEHVKKVAAYDRGRSEKGIETHCAILFGGSVRKIRETMR